MQVFKAEADGSPYVGKGKIYLIKEQTKCDAVTSFDPEIMPRNTWLNSAANLIWPNVEIPFVPGDYYDADRKEKK